MYIQIPAEDRLAGDEGHVAKFNLSPYGIKDAAKNCAKTYKAFLEQIGFATGLGSTCNFTNRNPLLAMTVHGYDFAASGSDLDLAWLRAQFEQLRGESADPGARARAEEGGACLEPGDRVDGLRPEI